MTPKLEALLKRAKETVDAMTPEEREAMLAAQRESWVRGELGWPKAKFRRVDGAKVYDSHEDYLND